MSSPPCGISKLNCCLCLVSIVQEKTKQFKTLNDFQSVYTYQDRLLPFWANSRTNSERENKAVRWQAFCSLVTYLKSLGSCFSSRFKKSELVPEKGHVLPCHFLQPLHSKSSARLKKNQTCSMSKGLFVL